MALPHGGQLPCPVAPYPIGGVDVPEGPGSGAYSPLLGGCCSAALPPIIVGEFVSGPGPGSACLTARGLDRVLWVLLRFRAGLWAGCRAGGVEGGRAGKGCGLVLGLEGRRGGVLGCVVGEGELGRVVGWL